MVMHHHEPDCLPKKFICCLQGQGQSEWSYNQNIYSFSNLSSELLILLQPNLVWWHIIIRWIVLWKDGIAPLRWTLRSQDRFKILVNVHLANISSTVEPFVTKLGMLIIHHGPECLAKRLVCCLQEQGHSEGSCNQIWFFLPYVLNCWSFLQPDLMGWYIVISWNVFCKN